MKQLYFHTAFFFLNTVIFANPLFLSQEAPKLYESSSLNGNYHSVAYGCPVKVVTTEGPKRLVVCGEKKGWTRALFLSPSPPQATKVTFSESDFKIEKINRGRARLGDSPLTMASRGFADAGDSFSAQKNRKPLEAEEDLHWLESPK